MNVLQSKGLQDTMIAALRHTVNKELMNNCSMLIVGAKEIEQNLTLVRELLSDSSICFVFSALAQSVVIIVIWSIMLLLCG